MNLQELAIGAEVAQQPDRRVREDQLQDVPLAERVGYIQGDPPPASFVNHLPRAIHDVLALYARPLRRVRALHLPPFSPRVAGRFEVKGEGS
jgi:hypothetical protein